MDVEMTVSVEGDGMNETGDNYTSTLVEEMENKYLCDEDFDRTIFIKSSGISPCKMALQRSLELLALNHKSIDRIGDEAKFFSFCRNVKEIDLGWNKLSCWAEISKLFSLPKLRLLNVGYNPLSESIGKSHSVARQLKILSLNGTDVPLSTVYQIVTDMPQLKELHLSENKRLGVEFRGELMKDACKIYSKTVDSLHVSYCELNDWKMVFLLRQMFPSCSNFFLSGNPIRNASYGGECNSNKLNGIKYLNLNKCLIDEWDDIDHIAEIDSLRYLRIHSIPLMKKQHKEENFHLIIGRIPQLEVLNGSIITSEQRVQSERFLLRFYSGNGCDKKPKILDSLIKKHGNVQQLCNVDMTPKMHAIVIIVCDEIGLQQNLTLLLAQTVLSLMKILEKMTNIPVHKMRLFYIRYGNIDFMPAELRFPTQELTSLHIEDGDKICVQSKLVITGKKKEKKSLI